MTFAEKFKDTRDNYKRACFGFEFFNTDTNEYEYGNIEYNEKTNRLIWNDFSVEADNDFSVEADNDFSVDENIEALYQVIMESGKYE